MVAAHAALADASERQPWHGQLGGRNAEGQAPGGSFRDQPPLGTLGRGEGVQGQRLVPPGDEGDGGVQVGDSDDGQDGTEDLVAHHGRAGVDIGQDGGGDVAGVTVVVAADDGPAVAQQAGQPVEVALVDDVAVVVAAGRIGAVHLTDRIAQVRLDPGARLAYREDVVGGDAGLARVHELAPGDTAGSRREVGARFDDGRALAAQLQSDRGEMTGRRRHDDTSDRAVAGVEDVVEPLLQQRGRLRHASLDDGHGPRVQDPGQPVGEHGRRRRSHLTRLEDHAVPGGQRTDDRRQSQIHRVVPGSDDQHRAQRLTHRPGAARHE
ncbi:hypothetical protein T45_09366 [Streptomyces turgidiscabies]|nr:hypothetical protein T45_09366 [Streptomyces turgidiscabies]